MKTGIPIIISAPSGAGKTTLIKLLMKNMNGLVFSISATTRPLSSNEKNGKDYFFISKQDFLSMEKNSEFVETALVHNHYYGTLKDQLDKKLRAGKNVILDIDVKGALNVKKQYPEALLIFVAPPSMKVLEERIKNRNRDTNKEIANRLANAKKEMKCRKFYDYVIINDDLDRTFTELKKIVTYAKK